MHVHATAHARPKLRPLEDDAACAWLWARLRATWPDALGACFMPNHLHLVVEGEPEEVKVLLASILSGFSRHVGAATWLAVDLPSVVRGAVEVSRQLRYLALNEARARLANCPLEARWSTHRDVIGAVADPWVTADRLAEALGVREDDFAAGWHAYVSADPSTDVAGTPMPTLREGYEPSDVAAATASALRVPLSAIQSRGAARALLVALAMDRGWTDKEALGAACSAAPRTLERLMAADPPPGLAAARMCLDERLRRPFPPRRDAPWRRPPLERG